jgi:excisionase family DNA binding protein
METIQKLNEIEALLKKQYALSKEILTLEEAVDYLSLSKSALYKLTSRKEITFYNPGGKKIYFRKAELENWIISKRIASNDEIQELSDAFLKSKNVKI